MILKVFHFSSFTLLHTCLDNFYLPTRGTIKNHQILSVKFKQFTLTLDNFCLRLRCCKGMQARQKDLIELDNPTK